MSRFGEIDFFGLGFRQIVGKVNRVQGSLGSRGRKFDLNWLKLDL